MRLRTEASERTLKAIAAIDRILDALITLYNLAYLDRTAYVAESTKWLAVKVPLQYSAGWHREAKITARRMDQLLNDPTREPPPEHT
jgi:hypothetical protein